MLLKSLFFYFFIFTFSMAAEKFPSCPHPKDFSTPGTLKKFETCQKKQKKYCDKFEKDTSCRIFLKNPLSYIENTLVGDQCQVLSNGQYRCKEKPLRFVEKGVVPQPKIQKVEEASEASAPETSPAPPASPSPTSSPET